MSDRIKQLLDKRAKAWAEAQDIRERAEREENRDLTTEEDQTFSRALDDVERLDRQVRDEERAARLSELDTPAAPSGEEAGERSGNGAGEYRDAFQAYLRYGFGRMSADQRQLVEGNFESLENRAQGTTPDAAGGYTVPDEMLNKITETMKAFGGLAGIVGGFATDSGNPLNWPTSDETAQEGEILAENTAAGTTPDLTFGTNTLGAHTYSSKVVRVSLQLIQDSGLDIEAFVGRKLGERLGRITAKHIANGTGTGQPQGVSAAAVGKTGAVSATPVITYDDLVDLEHSVDPAYRANAQYAFNDLTLAAIRKLKDANDRMLWVPSMVAGAPSTVNGRPYIVDNGLPAPAVSGKSVFFGDFQSGYILRRVNGGQLMRLSERYAEFLQVGFLSFLRLDGKLDDTAAIRSFQHGAAA